MPEGRGQDTSKSALSRNSRTPFLNEMFADHRKSTHQGTETTLPLTTPKCTIPSQSSSSQATQWHNSPPAWAAQRHLHTITLLSCTQDLSSSTEPMSIPPASTSSLTDGLGFYRGIGRAWPGQRSQLTGNMPTPGSITPTGLVSKALLLNATPKIQSHDHAHIARGRLGTSTSEISINWLFFHGVLNLWSCFDVGITGLFFTSTNLARIMLPGSSWPYPALYMCGFLWPRPLTIANANARHRCSLR